MGTGMAVDDAPRCQQLHKSPFGESSMEGFQYVKTLTRCHRAELDRPAFQVCSVPQVPSRACQLDQPAVCRLYADRLSLDADTERILRVYASEEAPAAARVQISSLAVNPTDRQQSRFERVACARPGWHRQGDQHGAREVGRMHSHRD